MKNEKGLTSRSKDFPSNLEKLIYPLRVHGFNNNVTVAGPGGARERKGVPAVVRRIVLHTKNTLFCILQKYLKPM